jgi:hypothetical protein
MKNIYIVGMAVVIAGCSTHGVRCRGTLQPINKPAATTQPAAPASKPHSVPREPRL